MDSEPIPAPAEHPAGASSNSAGVVIAVLKTYIFLLILFIILTSETFNRTILKKFDGAITYDGALTAYGVCMQGILLITSFAGVGYLIDRKIL